MTSTKIARSGAVLMLLSLSYAPRIYADGPEIEPQQQFQLQGESMEPPQKRTIFSKDKPEKNSEEAKTDIDARMGGLRSLSSFPLRLKAGADAEVDWPKEGYRDYQPAPYKAVFKAAKCVFSINTGEFTVGRFLPDGKGALQPVEDAVERSSTLNVDKGGVYLNLDTELYVRVNHKDEPWCKAVFAGHKILFGKIALASNALKAVSQNGTAAEVAEIVAAEAVDVYLVWDEQYERLMLEDEIGLVPTVKSAVYRITPQASDAYFLNADGKLIIQRASGGKQSIQAASLQPHHS